jgi:hypothetical protein
MHKDFYIALLVDMDVNQKSPMRARIRNDDPLFDTFRLEEMHKQAVGRKRSLFCDALQVPGPAGLVDVFKKIFQKKSCMRPSSAPPCKITVIYRPFV